MKLKVQLLCSALCLCMSAPLMAQTMVSTKVKSTAFKPSEIANRYVDSLREVSLRVVEAKAIDDEDIDPYYFPLLTTPTVYNAPLRQAFRMEAEGLPTTYASEAQQRQKLINDALLYAYTEHPMFIVGHEDALDPQQQTIVERTEPAIPNVSIAQITATATPVKEEPIAQTDLVVVKPNFWTFKGNYSLQFMQNHVSANWYKGGESNYSLHTGVNLNLTYNNKQKVVFENILEMKIGFRSSESDTVNKFKTTDDLIRLTNKLGLRATNHWYYTVMLQSWTQFYHGYRSNQRRVYSDFMSPFQSIFSIGMNYKLEKKKVKLSLDLSPLALNYISVSRGYLAPSFGIEAGRKSKTTFGSTFTANFHYQIMPNVTWGSRLYGFTNYKSAQVEWENTFNFTINKFLSSKLFLYPRFDDSRKRKEGESYIQFNEWLSVGLNLTF